MIVQLLGVDPRACLQVPRRNVSLEALATTEVNEIFSGRQLRQDVKVF